MRAPENLVEAVERLKPQAVLLLDTNTLMDNPRLESYEVAAMGPFLLVVPQVADNELLGLTFNNDPEKKQKASRAHKQLGKLYERGNPSYGIDVGNDRWVVTVSTPRPAATENTPIEEDQIWRYLGQVDAALLRLADACAEDIADTRSILITRDKNLTHVARSRGRSVCALRDLRSSQALAQPRDDHSGMTTDIEAGIASLLDTDDERPVEISMTLEEIRSEGDYLIARGIGNLTYDEQRHSFRWTYPYKNADRVEDPDSLLDMIEDTGVMPVENLDFMGPDEQIPDSVRRYACSVLEEAGWDNIWFLIQTDAFVRAMWESKGMEWEDDWKTRWSRGAYSLQSTNTRLRLAFIYMEGTEWSYQALYSQLGPEQAVIAQVEGLVIASLIGYIDWEQKKKALSQALSTLGINETNSLFKEYAMCRRLLIDGVVDFGDAYFATFEAHKALAEHLGGGPVSDPEAGLKWLLEVASDSWTVGQTRARNFTYRPFA